MLEIHNVSPCYHVAFILECQVKKGHLDVGCEFRTYYKNDCPERYKPV